MKIKNNNKGFTLIEMLIVIAIIAILSAIVLVGVNGFQASARDTTRIGDLKNIQNYLELYYNKCGYYPGTIDPTTGDCVAGDPPASWTDFVTQMNAGGISDQFPSDPGAPTRQFCYGVSADGNSYALGAVLEQGNSALTNNNGTLPTGVTFSLNGGTPACTVSGQTPTGNTYIVSS